MGIFNFFKKKTDIEEYYEEREKAKKNAKLEIKRDESTKQIEMIPNINITRELESLLNSNISKIEKVKKVRELTGISLKESKEMVDRIKVSEAVFKDINKDNESDLLAALLSSNISKIEKIKKIRELTGLSLKEAKDLVER